MGKTFLGMMNVRNEERWIRSVINSLLPLCDYIWVIDDHSTDKTVEILETFAPRVIVHRSPFDDKTDKVRDKNFIYREVLAHLPQSMLNEASPFWVVAIDGDEVLDKNGPEIIREAVENTSALSLAPQILYLWNRDDTIRADGTYLKMYRPSVFQVINPNFIFRPSGNFGGNCHTPNVPNDLVGNHQRIPAILWHYGYMDRSERLRKFLWYNKTDPNNVGEDFYRHMVIGDLPSVPEWKATKHAGPLELIKITDFLRSREREG